jgi:hypothetical protein
MPFLLLLMLLPLLFFLRLDTVTLLHFPQTKWIGYERLVSSLLLLLNSEQWVFTDLGCYITSRVCVLDSNEILVCSANLCE